MKSKLLVYSSNAVNKHGYRIAVSAFEGGQWDNAITGIPAHVVPATMDQVRQIQGSRSAAKRDSPGLVFHEHGSIAWGASGAIKNRSQSHYSDHIVLCKNQQNE